jgi:Schlafen, AlbA_2
MTDDVPFPPYLEPLLWRSEDDGLDFKRDQYRFEGATDEDRSELLKDILAMVNAWRSDEAFILVGVDELLPPGPGRVVGISEHLKDSNVQQLLNSRANRPIRFAYEAIRVTGKDLGVIRIPRQERPAFLKRDFGKLKRGVVYVRRGSATVEADADEIARMGAFGAATASPSIRVTFGDPMTLEPTGDHLALSNVRLALPSRSEIASLRPRRASREPFDFAMSAFPRNDRYEEEFADYLRDVAFYRPVVLVAENTSSIVAGDVRVALSIPAELVDATDSEPAAPDQSMHNIPAFRGMAVTQPHLPDVEIDRRGNVVSVRFFARKVQAGARVPSPVFYIGVQRSGEHAARGQIFTDQTPPIPFELHFTLTTEERVLILEDLRNAIIAFMEPEE